MAKKIPETLEKTILENRNNLKSVRSETTTRTLKLNPMQRNRIVATNKQAGEREHRAAGREEASKRNRAHTTQSIYMRDA